MEQVTVIRQAFDHAFLFLCRFVPGILNFIKRILRLLGEILCGLGRALDGIHIVVHVVVDKLFCLVIVLELLGEQLFRLLCLFF